MFSKNIINIAKENTNFRTVLETGEYCQLVVMSIPVGEEIGEEVHEATDQVLFFVAGECEAKINAESKQVTENDVVFVPAGSKHNFINTGDTELKLISLYAPAEHPDGTVHKTKADAETDEGH